jgi:hypothetical protein
LAFPAMLSVSGIWGQLQFGSGRLPQSCPKLPASQWQVPALSGTQKA